MNEIDARTDENITVESEIKRLTALYEGIPQNKMELVTGLIENAARLRVQNSELWDDMEKNGRVEWFTQSEKMEPYQRERPQARLYFQGVKEFHAITKTLDAMLPAGAPTSKLAEFLADDE